MVPYVCLQFVIVDFPEHTNLLFFIIDFSMTSKENTIHLAHLLECKTRDNNAAGTQLTVCSVMSLS